MAQVKHMKANVKAEISADLKADFAMLLTRLESYEKTFLPSQQLDKIISHKK